MGIFKNLDEAKEYFKGERFATANGMQINDLTDSSAVCSVILNDTHKNAIGGIMGGAIFTLADFAFAVLANHLHKPTVAQQVSINFLSIPKGEKLIATARIRKDGRSSSIINVDVRDDTGKDVAQFIGTGFKL